MSAPPGDGNPNPVFVTENLCKQVNYRVAEYVLCPMCEDRLNRLGETWTLRNSYRGGPTFPLRDSLVGSPAIYTLQQARLVDTRVLPTVDLSKLVYFAAAIFWKASAATWWAIDHPTRLDFGPYEKKFRQFLLGEEPFPDRAALLINVSGDGNPHIGAIYPYGGGRIQGIRQYRFAIPGMAFWLHIGQVSAALRAACAHHSGILCLAPGLNEVYVRDMGSLMAKFPKAVEVWDPRLNSH